MDIFQDCSNDVDLFQPLAHRMRPISLDELVGQAHVVGKDTILRRAIQQDRLFSMIFWGPPGCGKTTLANIIANETCSHFTEISAVLSGVKEIRQLISQAKDRKTLYRKRTILFVDEIHRFNKAQQDAFLPHVEKGTIVLIGATTENPSFEVIPALISRCRVITLNSLSHEEIKSILRRAMMDEKKGLGFLGVHSTEAALDLMTSFSDGDVRMALTNLETVAIFLSSKNGEKRGHEVHQGANEQTSGFSGTKRVAALTIDVEDVEKSLQKKALRYDKSSEEHYNLISAFHKSLRGSDPDAALYWLYRMLMAGEDPYYIIRRMVRFATEDVGMADPGALTAALNALESFRFLGHPEGDDALAQAAVYLATAPKSNRIYTAGKALRQEIEKSGYLPVPGHIRNAPTQLMKSLGYGHGYRYAHDFKDAYTSQEYLPDELLGRRFYEPTDRGYEKSVQQRLDAWSAMGKRSKPS